MLRFPRCGARAGGPGGRSPAFPGHMARLVAHQLPGLVYTSRLPADKPYRGAGIGGRVSESVGRKLKDLAAGQQVLCVTHQPQIASLADHHFIIEKDMKSGRTSITARELNAADKIEELARMLAGERITDQARENARAMLAAAK